MRASAAVNQYLAEQAPWALVKTDPRPRGDGALCRSLLRRLAEDALHPLPARSARRSCTSYSATSGYVAGPLEIRTETESDGSTHAVLTGDYKSWVGSLEAEQSCTPGQPLREPRPLFRKLPPETVDEELARMSS